MGGQAGAGMEALPLPEQEQQQGAAEGLAGEAAARQRQKVEDLAALLGREWDFIIGRCGRHGPPRQCHHASAAARHALGMDLTC